MKATSVHFKPCNIAASEAHNKRTKELSYVRKDLSHLNESFLYIEHSLRKELSNIAKRVKEKTGRKLQKNAEPIQECVIVIKEDTTVDELKQFCEACRQKFGITPLQIFTHKDEGHKRSKTWKPNLHAHIVWSVYNEEGRNVHIQRTDCCEMQTLAAQCLGMRRGKASDKKHQDALAYKIEQEEKYLAETAEMAKIHTLEYERADSIIKDQNAKLEELESEIYEREIRLQDMDITWPILRRLKIHEECHKYGIPWNYAEVIAEGKSVAVPYIWDPESGDRIQHKSDTIQVKWKDGLLARYLISGFISIKQFVRQALNNKAWFLRNGVQPSIHKGRTI